MLSGTEKACHCSGESTLLEYARTRCWFNLSGEGAGGDAELQPSPWPIPPTCKENRVTVESEAPRSARGVRMRRRRGERRTQRHTCEGECSGGGFVGGFGGGTICFRAAATFETCGIQCSSCKLGPIGATAQRARWKGTGECLHFLV